MNAKYKAFSEAAGLPEQRERMKVAYVDDKSINKAQGLSAQREAESAAAAERAALQNRENIAILKSKIESGEISTVIRPQVQARHIEGTPKFERYKAQRLEKGKTPQSILSVPMPDLQSIVDKSICTGTVTVKTRKDGSVEIKEYANAVSVIGKYFANNEYHDTKRMIIFYAKRGTHVVPTNPEEDRKW